MSQRLQGVRVLVVEDDEDCRELFRTMLELDGATVRVVSNAWQAIKMLGPFCPHVVVSDLELPDEDGCWLIANARVALWGDGRFPATIIVTAHTDERVRRRCLGAGCDVFLTKPVDDAELRAIVARLAFGSAPAGRSLAHTSTSR